MKLIGALATVLLGLASAGTHAADLTALVGLPSKHVVDALTPQFEKETGHKILITYSGGVDTRQRMSEGQVFDVLVANRQDLELFESKGQLSKDGITDLMASKVGVAVRPGVAKPDLTADGLKAAMLQARAIGVSTGPSGDYLLKTLFPKLGISDQVSNKLVQVPSGTSVGMALADGRADIGVQQVSELNHVPGVDFVGPLPPDLQLTTVYAAAVHGGARQPEAAKSFIRLLSGPDAASVIRDFGMEPP